MDVLFAIAGVLLVVMLVGHGMWLVVAAVFRAMRESGAEHTSGHVPCVYCDRLTPESVDRCRWCGRNRRGLKAAELADLQATARQLKRFRAAKILDPVVAARLLDRVHEYRQRLLGRGASPAAQPEPVISPPKQPEVAAPVPDKSGEERPIILAPVPPPAAQPEVPPSGVPDRAAADPPRPPQKESPVSPKPPARKPGATERPAQPTRPSRPVAPKSPEPVRPQAPQPAPRLTPKPVQRPARPRRVSRPKPPRKSVAEMLSAFMEERNMRWGELVGGLLIVGFSTLLVLSLREKLEDTIPFFPFLVASTITAAVFGVGLHAEYRWKLRSNSRTLLIIATLLVPLNFMFMAIVRNAENQVPWDPMAIAVEAVSLGLFAWLVWLAGRVLVPRWRGALVVAVLGGSLALLLSIPLFPSSGSVWPMLAVGGLALAAYLLGLVPPLQRLAREKQLDAGGANEWFTLLGTAAFALILAMGLTAYRAAHDTSVALVLSQLSVLASVAAVPILVAGLAVMRTTGDNKEMASYRMAGTWVALVGAIVMLAALAMAWPRPVPVVLVGILSAIVLVTAAIRFRLPAIHAGAIACLAVVYLTGYHLISDLIAGTPPGQRGGVESLRLIFEAQSGAALAGLLVILGGLFVWLEHRGLRRHSIMYAGGCLVTAVLSLLTVTAHGLTHRADPDLVMAMSIYAVYGIGSLALAARLRRPMPAYLGLGLLVGASAWALGWRTEQIGMPWATVLSAEALGMGLLGVLIWRPSRQMLETPDDTPVPSEAVGMLQTFRLPLLHTGEIVAILALVLGIGSAVYSIAETAAVLPVLTAAFVVATYLLLAWAHQSPERTWVASTVGLLGLIHTMGFNFIASDGQTWVEQPWLVALLTHATLGVVAGAVMELWGKRGQLKGPQEKVLGAVRRVLVEPLSQGALITSAAALPVLLVSQWNETLAMAGCLFWLAAIWLVVAVMNRSAALFALHQGILCVATVVGMVAWLQRIDTVAALPNHLFVLRCLQACGIGLGLLVLFWTTARILLRGNALAQTLLQPSWPTVDWFLRHGLVGGQLLLVGCYMLLGCGAELWSTGDVTARILAATSGWAWLLLAVSSAGLIVALWQRAGTGEMVNGLLLAAVVPCLVAGRFAPDLATATALRWGLAAGYLIVSVAFWQRRSVGAWLTEVGVRPEMIAESPRIGRGVLLAVTGVPVLVITLVAALLQMGDANRVGPLDGSFFRNMGSTWAYVVPLLLVMGTMVGHALRETSAGYVFFAGLVAEIIVVLGYVLGVVTAGRPFGTIELVTLLQLATITAAVWAIGWMALRRWTTAWSQRGSTPTARALMDVQLSFASLGNLALLVPALFALTFSFGHVQTWTQAAGGPLGWLALLTAVGAGAYRQIQSHRRLRPQLAGLFGMAMLGLAACSVHGMSEELGYEVVWGYRTLMLGWALYSLFVALATWWVATQRTLPGAAGPPQALIRAASVWVTTAGLLAVLLGLNAAIWHQEQLWAASAIAVASIAGAAMAVWRRREEWALAAGAGVNLAASLVVWHICWETDFSQWWTLLVQANVIASSAVALIWLSARRRLYQLRELSLGESPLLGLQTALGTLGNFVLLFVPVVCLVGEPMTLPHWAHALADPPGWIALLLAGAASAWYLRQVSPGNLPDIAAGFGLGLGVLLACGSERLALASVSKSYLAYHVLTASWTALAVVLLAAGWFCRKLQLTPAADAPSKPVAPAAVVRNWVSLVGGLALFLAVINSAGDPSRPWWSVGVVLALSATAGGLAVGFKMPSYVYLSGLLINTAGMIAWWSNPWTGATFTGFVQVNALCLAAGSAIWSVVHLLRPTDRGELPFAHLAIRVALAALGLLVAGGFFCDLAGVDHTVGDQTGWLALAAVALATAICLWDRSSRFSLPGLYVVALTAVGMGLVARPLSTTQVCWTATIELAAFVLATTLLGQWLRHARPLVRALLVPDDEGRWPAGWFGGAQIVVGTTAAMLSVAVAVRFKFDLAIPYEALGWMRGRMAGPLAVAMLLPAAVLLARRATGPQRAGWQYAVLALGLALPVELGCAWLSPDIDAVWLHRSVVAMVSAVAMTLVAGLGLGRILPESSDWLDAGRKAAGWFGMLASAMLVVVLVAEGVHYDPVTESTPMALPAVLAVAAALAALMAAAIGFAVMPDRDPLGLSERGRTLYVYGAELLLALICVHIRITLPWLFGSGFFVRNWPLILMGVAFLGTGLSEWFHRRGLPVLAEPLERTAMLLPLVPGIAFFFIDKAHLGSHPVMLFLIGLFYGLMWVTRRRFAYALLSGAVTQLGVWVLLNRQEGFGFFDHPQLWLIPLALAALVAEHLNRDRLEAAQVTAIRYLALGTIYLSSTFDMFLAGIGESFWMPLVLIALSVTGVLAGILLRIQSFLYLGVLFLVFVLGTLIWHAAFVEEQKWLLYVCGIAIGVAVITLFAFFEKRRNDVLAALDQFKQWEK